MKERVLIKHKNKTISKSHIVRCSYCGSKTVLRNDTELYDTHVYECFNCFNIFKV